MEPVTGNTNTVEPRRWNGGNCTTKKDNAPRGVRTYPSGAWGIQWRCGCGKFHKERVGALKGDAIRAYYERKKWADAGRCPAMEASERQRQQAARVIFRAYAEDYLTAARADGKRSWTKDESRLRARILPTFGDRKLD